MPSMLRAVCLATAVLAFAIGVAVVSRPAAAQGQDLPPQVQLTPGLVESFIASYPQLQALGKQLEQRYGRAAADPEDPTSGIAAFAAYAEARGQIEQIITAHGIGSLEDWTRIAYSVMLAYSFAERGDGGGSVDSEMAEAMEQIRGDRNIPAAQKEQLIAMLEQQMAAISQLRPPAGNIEAVTPYLDQIRSIAEAD
jgi:hypothetical protein